jgi:hypothetical protein
MIDHVMIQNVNGRTINFGHCISKLFDGISRSVNRPFDPTLAYRHIQVQSQILDIPPNGLTNHQTAFRKAYSESSILSDLEKSPLNSSSQNRAVRPTSFRNHPD